MRGVRNGCSKKTASFSFIIIGITFFSTPPRCGIISTLFIIIGHVMHGVTFVYRCISIYIYICVYIHTERQSLLNLGSSNYDLLSFMIRSREVLTGSFLLVMNGTWIEMSGTHLDPSGSGFFYALRIVPIKISLWGIGWRDAHAVSGAYFFSLHAFIVGEVISW